MGSKPARLIVCLCMIAGRPSVEHSKIGVQNSVPPISNFNFRPGKQAFADPFRLVEVERSTGDAVNYQGGPGPEG